jgi:hypothetical protein
MSKVALQRPGIVTVVSYFVTADARQHVRCARKLSRVLPRNPFTYSNRKSDDLSHDTE